jgi:hypothetical protein
MKSEKIIYTEIHKGLLWKRLLHTGSNERAYNRMSESRWKYRMEL